MHLGFVLQSGALIFFGVWVIHLFHLLYGLLFPIRAMQLSNSKKFQRYVHLTEVLVVLVCGLLPSVITVSTSGYQYTGFRNVCTSRLHEVFFYTLMLPMSIEATFGLSMLLICLWILCKVYA